MSTDFASTANQTTPQPAPDPRQFATPLGDVKSGRLALTHGLANATLLVDAAMPDLYRARIEDPEIDVEVSGGTVTFHRVRPPLGEWLKQIFAWGKRLTTITLNGSIPWEIEVRGGVSHLQGDLTALPLRSFAIGGGVSNVELILPAPTGTVPIQVDGGASNVTLHRPSGVAARFRAHGGVARLTFDDQQFGGISGDLRQETPNYHAAADRYHFDLKGGVSNVTVDSSQ
ncbi:MAG: hypothetical protein ACRDJH_01905 [Thermomicrobiales bacterium]